MKLLATIILLIYLHGVTSEELAYSTKYDGVDLNEVLSNDRLTTGYINCLLDNGPCSPEAKELKKNLPDAIQNDCMKCSSRQREGADQVLDFIIDHRPEDWEKLEKM
ncbi:unnamed protein product [Diatraea saccharalis]|uniref:Chemosensory protein n=1 Tax=Diatraea saccharalis TaxID=40085 RepID=A0A9P0G478_9NEOP|nr:unnamed protein product [Diatraea saccharalis]